MLYVKIMSAEALEDTNPYKHFQIVPIDNKATIQFVDNPFYVPPGSVGTCSESPTMERFRLVVTSPEGSSETYALFGNAYVMSENGKTIASHGA